MTVTVFCVIPGCLPNCIVSFVQCWLAVTLVVGWCPPSVSVLPCSGEAPFLLLTWVVITGGFTQTSHACWNHLPVLYRGWNGTAFDCVLLIGQVLEWVIFVDYKGLHCWSCTGANPLAHHRWSRSECCLKRLSHGSTNVLWPEDVFLTSKGFSAWLGASQTESAIPLCSWCVLTMCDFFGMWYFLKAALTCVRLKLALKLVNTNLSCGQFSS